MSRLSCSRSYRVACRLTALLLAWVSIAVLTPGVGALAVTPRTVLRVTPTRTWPGVPLRFTGSLATALRRPVIVERSMNGGWVKLRVGHTDASGRFLLRSPMNVMTFERYRVYAPAVRRGGRLYPAEHTPTRKIRNLGVGARLIVSANLDAVAGQPFTIAGGSNDQPGRPLELQQRTSPTSWRTIASARAGADARASFTVTAPTPGTYVYRVVAQDWRGEGWIPSFPGYVTVAPAAQATTSSSDATASARAVAGAARRTAVPAATPAEPGPINAANTYRWGAAVENWGWEEGESTDPWRVYADGTGRVTSRYGMLTLESGGFAPRFFGSLKATLGNTGHAYGRWEARVRAYSRYDRRGDPYRLAFNLVPAAAGTRACPGSMVNLGTWTGKQAQTTLGVRRGDTQWSARRRIAHGQGGWHTLAVEITPARISWFVDAKVVETLRTPAAVPGVRLVPQLVMRDVDGAAMIDTRLQADWVRYFSLKHPDQRSVKAPAPTRAAAPDC